MVIVALDRKTVTTDIVVVATIVALVFGADIIVAYSLDERIGINDLYLIWVEAVIASAETVGRV